MLRYVSYDIVFQEVPGEVSLAINISGCPNRCKGCHSPYLMEDIGEILDEKALSGLLDRYKRAITCVCFMGGDSEPQMIDRLAEFVRKSTAGQLKMAWYSGKRDLSPYCSLPNFDYLKLGPYIETLGGLDSPGTNQRFYKIANGTLIDQTYCFVKKEVFAF